MTNEVKAAARKQLATKPAKCPIIPGHLERVDFDNPKVIAAILNATAELDESKYRDRLEQFETRCTTGLQEYVD